MQTLQLVENGKALVDAMGFWPSFHDANVLVTSRDSDCFAVTAHIFAMTDQVDSDGYYILDKHHLVTIVLHGVQSNSLPPDYSTDCLDGLSFERDGAFLQVEFGSHMDQGGTVVCRKAEITGVIPCTSKGVPLAPDNSPMDPPRKHRSSAD